MNPFDAIDLIYPYMLPASFTLSFIGFVIFRVRSSPYLAGCGRSPFYNMARLDPQGNHESEFQDMVWYQKMFSEKYTCQGIVTIHFIEDNASKCFDTPGKPGAIVKQVFLYVCISNNILIINY